MRDIIKEKLSALLVDLTKWEDLADTGEFDENVSLLFPSKALSIANFLKECGIDSNDDDIVSISKRIIEKSENLERREEEAWDRLEVEREEEYWERKECYTATDIGILLGISSNGIKANQLLSELGLQIRKEKGWIKTEKAESLGVQHNLEEGQAYVSWNKEIIEYISKEISEGNA